MARTKDPTDINDQINEMNREGAMRRNVYPRQVQAGKLTQAEADFRIAVVTNIAALLSAIREQTTPPEQPTFETPDLFAQ